MTLGSKKSGRRGGEAREGRNSGADSAAEDSAADAAAATPYKGSRCCVGFFQCQVCSHEWSSVFSWANTGQLCKPCSSKRRQTWVLPFRQIPKSRKYEFFCIDCDQYIAESYRNKDAHQGIACKSCKGIVFPDWEFPCDGCNVVHLYSFPKTDAMRGIDCECGAFLFPKHMKSLNRKHEARFCQKCQELGVNCCNFKAKSSAQQDETEAAETNRSGKTGARSDPRIPSKKADRPRRPQRQSVSSVEAAGEAETNVSTARKKSAPRRKSKTYVSSDGAVEKTATGGRGKPRPQTSRKPKTSVSSVEGGVKEAAPAVGERKPNQRRKPRVSFSSVEGEETEKPVRRTAPKQVSRASVSSVDGEGASAGENAAEKRRRRPAPKRKPKPVSGEVVEGEEVLAETANRVAKSAPRGRGGRGGRGGGSLRGKGGLAALKQHVYGEDDVLRHARTPKNSVATDPGIREAKKPGKPRGQRRQRGDTKTPVGDEEVDALADQVAESVIISAKRVIVEENNNIVAVEENNNIIVAVEEADHDKSPRQQKDENDNSIILEKKSKNETDDSSPSKSETGVELKGGHAPAIKVGGRRRVSSGRKSESEGKKTEVQVARPEDSVGAEPASKEASAGAADPENSKVEVLLKSRSINHSEMTSVPEKPSPTKDVNRMPKVHPHYPTNKHPIQQPRKC